MSKIFSMVPLGELLIKSDELVEIHPNKRYKQVTVRLWGKGVVQRDEVNGAEIAAKKRHVVRSQQFILSHIDARSGAFGLIPESLNGAVVSNDFPTFKLDNSQIIPKYLNWISKTNNFVELCKAASEGTTNRVRLKEDVFLEIKIPLPPLDEQRRIVARIEELAAKIEGAHELRKKAREELKALFESAVGTLFNQFNSVERKKLSTLTTKIGSGSTPKGGRASYPSSGIPFIRSLNVRMRYFQWNDIAFIDKTTHDVMRGTIVKPNDVLLNITGASIGRVVCAPSDLAEANVNQHVVIIRPIEELNPQYLMYWLSQPSIQEFINDKQKGATRQGFTKAQIESFEVPIPPLPEQRRIVAYLDALQEKVDTLKHLQSETSAKLDALLPAVLDKAFKGEL